MDLINTRHVYCVHVSFAFLHISIYQDPNDLHKLDIQFLFISPSPATQQIAVFGIAFSIILEYSFHLWDPAPSSSIKYLASAIDVYKSSSKHVTVTAAVEKIFEEEKRLFVEVEGIENSSKSTFAQKLTQIALENCLHLK
ncbi:hypothetical protein BYT27DRAFT_6825376 [Phlegmacium glaucopus]|nr:hypothetical protein BYT27DRAFT_6825376 [Phlegmacium glaucopus]